MLHTQKIIFWHDFGGINHLREFYRTMEAYTYKKYAKEANQMAKLVLKWAGCNGV